MNMQTLVSLIGLLAVLLPVMLKVADVAAQLYLQSLPAAKAQALRAQLDQVRQLIQQQVVPAIEQANQAIPGAQKKAIAQQMIAVQMHQLGLTATPEQVDTLIESAVHAMNVAKTVAAATPSAAATAAVVSPPSAPSPTPKASISPDMQPTVMMSAVRG